MVPAQASSLPAHERFVNSMCFTLQAELPSSSLLGNTLECGFLVCDKVLGGSGIRNTHPHT